MFLVPYALTLLIGCEEAPSTDGLPERRFVRSDPEALRASPAGQEVGIVDGNTPVQVLEADGDWLKVAVEGWVPRSSTSAEPDTVRVRSPVPPGHRLKLVGFRKNHIPEDYSELRYKAEAQLILTVQNNTDSVITAWTAVLVVRSPFGDVLFRTRVTDGNAQIAPGHTAEATFGWKDDQFDDDEPYDILMAYSVDNLHLQLLSAEFGP